MNKEVFDQPGIAPPVETLAELAGRINAEHLQAEHALREGLLHAQKAGELLLEAKRQCRHGEWLPWLKANVQFSARTAQAYMRVAKRWPELEAKAQHVADLPYREAIGLLSQPDQKEATPEDAEESLQRALQAYRAAFAKMRQTLADPNCSVEDCLAVRDSAIEAEADLHAFMTRLTIRVKQTLQKMSVQERRRIPPEVRSELRKIEADD